MVEASIKKMAGHFQIEKIIKRMIKTKILCSDKLQKPETKLEIQYNSLNVINLKEEDSEEKAESEGNESLNNGSKTQILEREDTRARN